MPARKPTPNRHQGLGETAAVGPFLRPTPSFLKALRSPICYLVPSSFLPHISAKNGLLTCLVVCRGLWLTHLVVLRDETKPNMLAQPPHVSESNVRGDIFIISRAQDGHKPGKITSLCLLFDVS